MKLQLTFSLVIWLVIWLERVSALGVQA